MTHPWPELPLAPWRGTRDTLHMWTQILGKTLLACPPENHWWHCSLRVSARGLASRSLVLTGDHSFEVEFDLVDHVLAVRSDASEITTPLAPRTVRSFYEEYLSLVRAELLQAIGRGRALLPNGIPVFAVTTENLGDVCPIADHPYARLTQTQARALRVHSSRPSPGLRTQV